MLAVLVAVCVGLAGDGWSYAKAESRPGVSRPAAATRPASVQSSFAPRSVAKLVEHAPVAKPVQPSPQRLFAREDGTWGPDEPAKPSVNVNVAVKPQPPRVNVKVADDPEVPKAWWTIPEDPTLEGYGNVVWDNGSVVLKYVKTRPKQVFPAARPVVRQYAVPVTNYYPIYTQVPVACAPGRG